MSTATATTYQLGKGSTLAIIPPSGTSTVISQLSKITFSAAKTSFVDITNLTSPGNYKEQAPTIKDPGTVTVTGIWMPPSSSSVSGDPGQIAVTAAFEAQTLCAFLLQFPVQGTQTTGPQRTFSAYVSTRPQMDAQTTEVIDFNFDLTVSGPVTDVAAVYPA